MTAGQPPDERPEGAPVHREIDDILKQIYGDARDDEVPDRFEKLIAQLRTGEIAEGDAADETGEPPDETD